MRLIVLIASLLFTMGCGIYVATAADAEEARLANEFLNSQLTDGEEVIVNWRPAKNHIELSVLAPVDDDRKQSAIAALRKQQIEEGWRTIEVIFKNGAIERVKAGT